MAASIPARGTREYEWWLAGAEAEAAARKEGRSMAGLAVRDLVDAFAENFPDMTEVDIAREVHHIIVGASSEIPTSRNGAPRMAAPVEKKVTAATAAAYVGSTALLGELTAVQDHHELLTWMPGTITPFVLALVPTAITFVSGYLARHTPRSLA